MESPRMLVQGARTAADLMGKKEVAKREVDSARSSAGKERKREAQEEVANQQRYPVNAELRALFKQIEDYVAERVEVRNFKLDFRGDLIVLIGLMNMGFGFFGQYFNEAIAKSGKAINFQKSPNFPLQCGLF